MFWHSIRILLGFWKQRGMWKVLGFCFGIGMCVFTVIIFGLVVTWMIKLVESGLFNLRLDPSNPSGIFTGKWQLFLESTKDDISNTAAFRCYIIIFALILIWSIAGVVFEVLKNIFGGNKKIAS